MMVRQAHHKPFVSVIIPSLNDEDHLKRNTSLLNQDPRIEVIVVRAEEIGKANRASQMNLGAKQAQGDLLVFLHADTKVHPDDLIELAHLMSQSPKWVGGAFRFALDRNGFKDRLIEFGVWLRERVFQLPYGDQAIFVRRSVFEAIGGYPDVPLLEDVLLVKKLRSPSPPSASLRTGFPLPFLRLRSGQAREGVWGRGFLFYPKKAVTSSRRWERHGYLKTTLVNWTTMILWRLGVSLKTIINFRRRIFNDAVRGDVKRTSARNQTEAA